MARRFITYLSLIFIMLLSVSSCKNNNKETLLGNICDTSNTKFATVINPIIITNCNTQAGCHGVSAGSISLEGYANVNNSYSDILDRIKSGNMPKGLGKLDECTISKIETWINKGHQDN